ncbi:ABC transporter related protein [Pseudonocardia dioxanivorans CB1190]|uniref:ABC transporter related protein n=2 Tax=Pseudonocardia dioxanivorans TaxID=240495 RepID=F4CIT8_PSEUX|nr:ABC transporter related protein [Pseudonocardia dioxanivorans CB1190]
MTVMEVEGVRLEGVRKRYGRRSSEVLVGIDLHLRPGRPVVLRGGNGSGKSTLLRIAAGASSPTAGRVVGRPRTVGYVPDRLPAQQRMPVGVYLRHLAAIHGAGPDAVREATELLAVLGFTAGAATPMLQLSKGNAQKVGLAQALTCGAGLVVLDEPWSGLDADASPALAARLDAMSAAGTVVLVADHTAHGPRLAGAQVYRVEAGTLRPEEPAPVADEITVIELAGDGDPRAAVRTLPPGAETRVVPGPGPASWRLRLRVPASEGDAVLAAAIARGATVLAVRREPVDRPVAAGRHAQEAHR